MQMIKELMASMQDLFGTPRFVANNLNLVFARQPLIRRWANEFEDQLAGDYEQPEIPGLPDDFDPEAPRLIFRSKHGFSSIAITQVGIALAVNFSPDWQVNGNLRSPYLAQRLSLLYTLFSVISNQDRSARPLFFGLATIVQLETNATDAEVISHLAKAFGVDTKGQVMHDLLLRFTTVIDGMFFSNITAQNYRRWRVDNPIPGVLKLPLRNVVERGIRLESDFNDRYAYQEADGAYVCSEATAGNVMERGLHEIAVAIERL